LRNTGRLAEAEPYIEEAVERGYHFPRERHELGNSLAAKAVHEGIDSVSVRRDIHEIGTAGGYKP
jgi:hypothetical protein